MTSQERAFHEFADFASRLKGDEKSEAQTLLFHLLEAFGHDNNTLPENSSFEYRVRFSGSRTKFADFVWPGRALIEMKSRGGSFPAITSKRSITGSNSCHIDPLMSSCATSTSFGFTTSIFNFTSR